MNLYEIPRFAIKSIKRRFCIFDVSYFVQPISSWNRWKLIKLVPLMPSPFEALTKRDNSILMLHIHGGYTDINSFIHRFSLELWKAHVFPGTDEAKGLPWETSRHTIYGRYCEEDYQSISKRVIKQQLPILLLAKITKLNCGVNLIHQTL